MILLMAAAAANGTGSFSFDLNSIVSGGTGAALFALVVWVFKLILDRTIPTRSDHRADYTMLIDGLSNMVRVLQEEKIADAKRLADKQIRIDTLEGAADKDYETIADLRGEILDLRQRLNQKDRHIQLLTVELRKLGAVVTGLDISSDDEDSLEITLPTEVRRREPKPNTSDVDII